MEMEVEGMEELSTSLPLSHAEMQELAMAVSAWTPRSGRAQKTSMPLRYAPSRVSLAIIFVSPGRRGRKRARRRTSRTSPVPSEAAAKAVARLWVGREESLEGVRARKSVRGGGGEK